MEIAVKNIINYFVKKPARLFLVDSIGAALTAFLLFFVLRQFQDHFGIPTWVLIYLSLIGLIFCLYSLTCFLLLKGNWTPFLMLIALGNLLYCVLTLVCMYTYIEELTKLGGIYFLLEIATVLAIVFVEFRVAAALKNDKKLSSG
ncbi:hypothetical protein [Algoriphagus confluentis]|uniref:Uncharacterized protein n=1 Tax=Algoriphagus confluentis TaxID=1697556 RepID=A0ABQ6PUL8_9BACT|nr:hypothetical protein Aconfl_35980 [Algoriphagus confluentis]